MELMLHDPHRPCVFCKHAGSLRFTELPPSRLVYELESDGVKEEHTHHNGPSREYYCDNCSGEFLLFELSDGGYDD